MDEERLRSCCFTGHRPAKLDVPEREVRKWLEEKISEAAADGYRTFISGMAYGTDIWAGTIVVRLKDRFPNLKLIAAVPFPDFSVSWNDEWKRRYEILISRADQVRFICPEYRNDAYMLRNQWMVNHSGRLIAVYSGRSGGTENTIRYARQAGLTIKTLKGS